MGKLSKGFETIDFGTMIKNTMIIALVTLTAEFVLGIMGSFAISRFKIGKGKLQRFFYTYFIVGLIIPVFLLIYPIYKMNFMLGTLDTPMGSHTSLYRMERADGDDAARKLH